MRIRACVAFAVLLLGCSGSAGGKYTRTDSRFADLEASRDALVKEFLGFIEQKDDRGIAHMLQTPLGYGGLWFPDTACRRRFSGAGVIPEAGIDELAKCVSTLPIKLSERKHGYADVAVFEYEPGIEIEALFDPEEGGHLSWIGFVGRRDVKDALPTVTQASRLAQRNEIAPLALDEATRKAIDDELAVDPEHEAAATAWFKVCIDATGAVTGVHPRLTSSLTAQDALATWIRTWTFRSYKLGEQPSPVCSMLWMSTEGERPGGVMPFPVPPDLADAIVVELGALGAPLEEATKTGITIGRPRLEGTHTVLRWALLFCIDTVGQVDKVYVMRSSGDRKLDDEHRKGFLTRRYAPLVFRGTPVRACAHVRGSSIR
jgi:hypothetical protein